MDFLEKDRSRIEAEFRSLNIRTAMQIKRGNYTVVCCKCHKPWPRSMTVYADDYEPATGPRMCLVCFRNPSG